MPTIKLSDHTDVEDFIRGLAFMGTGGGGRPEAGRELLLRHLERGEPLGWTDAAELPDDAWACCAYTMGSTAPRPAGFQEGQVRPEYGQRALGSALPRAIRELEAYTGKVISVVFPGELGASNTPAPLHAAVELGLKLIDGDASGRAVPESAQSIPELNGKCMWPAAICDEWGNALILVRATSIQVAEALEKSISIVTKTPDPYAFCGVAAHLMTVGEMKRVIVQGSLSAALALGRAIRQARERGQDPVAAATRLTGGWLLFRGLVSKREWKNEGGYQIGTTDISGTGEHAGHTYRIWFKNEHHISWLDGRPHATSPDLIVVVQAETGEPITNTYLAEGDRVAVIGVAAPAILRTAAAVRVLGPRHFGFDLPYLPIEQVLKPGCS